MSQCNFLSPVTVGVYILLPSQSLVILLLESYKIMLLSLLPIFFSKSKLLYYTVIFRSNILLSYSNITAILLHIINTMTVIHCNNKLTTSITLINRYYSAEKTPPTGTKFTGKKQLYPPLLAFLAADKLFLWIIPIYNFLHSGGTLLQPLMSFPPNGMSKSLGVIPTTTFALAVITLANPGST